MKTFEKWNQEHPLCGAYCNTIMSIIQSHRKKVWRAALEWAKENPDKIAEELKDE